MRESGINEKGDFEDEYLYAILRNDWLRPYDKSGVKVVVYCLEISCKSGNDQGYLPLNSAFRNFHYTEILKFVNLCKY